MTLGLCRISSKQAQYPWSIVSGIKMHRFFVLLSLLITYLSTVSALTLAPISNLTINGSLSNVSPNSEAHCAQEGRTGSPSPLLSDCITAVHSLPRSPYVGTFHIGTDTSLWRLPESRSWNSCKVLVTLSPDFDLEMGSWMDIRAAAVTLAITCRLPFEPGGEQRTGGWIMSGAEDGIVIELIRSRHVGANAVSVE